MLLKKLNFLLKKRNFFVKIAEKSRKDLATVVLVSVQSIHCTQSTSSWAARCLFSSSLSVHCTVYSVQCTRCVHRFVTFCTLGVCDSSQEEKNWILCRSLSQPGFRPPVIGRLCYRPPVIGRLCYHPPVIGRLCYRPPVIGRLFYRPHVIFLSTSQANTHLFIILVILSCYCPVIVLLLSCSHPVIVRLSSCYHPVIILYIILLSSCYHPVITLLSPCYCPFITLLP